MEIKLTGVDAILVTTQKKDSPEKEYTLYAESSEDDSYIPLGRIAKEVAERL